MEHDNSWHQRVPTENQSHEAMEILAGDSP